MPKIHDNRARSFRAEDSLCLLLARGRLTSHEQFRTREHSFHQDPPPLFRRWVGLSLILETHPRRNSNNRRVARPGGGSVVRQGT